MRLCYTRMFPSLLHKVRVRTRGSYYRPCVVHPLYLLIFLLNSLLFFLTRVYMKMVYYDEEFSLTLYKSVLQLKPVEYYEFFFFS